MPVINFWINTHSMSSH